MEFVQFLERFVPGMQMTDKGAKQVIGFMRATNNMNAQKYAELQAWKKTQPPDTDLRQFEVPWNQKIATFPLTSEQSFGAPPGGTPLTATSQPQPVAGNVRSVPYGGKTYNFPTPAAATAFKQKMGIQ
jgi:hypothetical protein